MGTILVVTLWGKCYTDLPWIWRWAWAVDVGLGVDSGCEWAWTVDTGWGWTVGVGVNNGYWWAWAEDEMLINTLFPPGRWLGDPCPAFPGYPSAVSWMAPAQTSVSLHIVQFGSLFSQVLPLGLGLRLV